MPKQFFTPETPVGATALAVIGRYLRILANLGKFLINFTSGLAKKITQSRGLLCVVAVCLRPKTEPTGTTSEAKKNLRREEIPRHLLQVRHFCYGYRL